MGAELRLRLLVPGRRQPTREADRVWGSWPHTAATPQSEMPQVLFWTETQMGGTAAWLEDAYRKREAHRLP